jgi:hypothetical protein
MKKAKEYLNRDDVAFGMMTGDGERSLYTNITTMHKAVEIAYLEGILSLGWDQWSYGPDEIKDPQKRLKELTGE